MARMNIPTAPPVENIHTALIDVEHALQVTKPLVSMGDGRITELRSSLHNAKSALQSAVEHWEFR